MTDPKRTTLPGPGSQPSHPVPEPPSSTHATAVLGTLPSGARVERSLPPEEAEAERPGFDPFKFQRITVPPGLRADMIRWSREGKDEPLPTETLPPTDLEEAWHESASPESDESDDPGSMTPVGGSAAPRLPLRSVRGFALAAGIVILPLAVLGLASAMRKSPDTDASNPAAPHARASEPSLPAARAVTPVGTVSTVATGGGVAKTAPVATTATPVAPVERTSTAVTPAKAAPAAPPSASATPALAAASTRSPRAPATAAREPAAEPPRPIRSAETASGDRPKENALDRPFSLPK